MAGLGTGFDEDEDVIAGINVTPLVDVALVLLIIFIATSAIIIRAAINVDLPRAASAGEAVPDSVALLLDEGGTVYLNGIAVAPDALRAALEEEVLRNPEVRALIAADADLRYRDVMDLIDTVRLAGFAGFSLNVERESEDE